MLKLKQNGQNGAASVEDARHAAGKIEGQLAVQRKRLAQAEQEKEALDSAWSVATLAADVDGDPLDDEIASIENQQTANRREIQRAEHAIAELERRLDSARIEERRRAYERDCADLQVGAAKGHELADRCWRASIEHVDAAAALRKHNQEQNVLYRRVFDYASEHGERPPTVTRGAEPIWYDGWLKHEQGPQQVRQERENARVG